MVKILGLMVNVTQVTVIPLEVVWMGADIIRIRAHVKNVKMII
jgi:hypothetical protein